MIWMIVRETIVDGTSLPARMILGLLPLRPIPMWSGQHKIIEVADIALWRIEQRHEFREAGVNALVLGSSGSADSYWHVNMGGSIEVEGGHFNGDGRYYVKTMQTIMIAEADRPHAHCPYVVHRVIDRAHALVRYSKPDGIARIYVAEIIPAEERAVALDACLHNDQESLRRARRICEEHATTEKLAHLALDTIIIEANLARERERTASYL